MGAVAVKQEGGNHRVATTADGATAATTTTWATATIADTTSIATSSHDLVATSPLPNRYLITS